MPSKITPPKPWPAWGVPASVPSTLRVDLAEALSECAGGWAKFRMSELERDVEGGRNAIWAEQLYWKSELPGPLVNDLGREFEKKRFIDTVLNGSDAWGFVSSGIELRALSSKWISKFSLPGAIDCFERGAAIHSMAWRSPPLRRRLPRKRITNLKLSDDATSGSRGATDRRFGAFQAPDPLPGARSPVSH